MEISASVPTRSGDVTAAGTTDRLAAISGDDFLKVLIKQLQMQDPLQPMSNQEMVQQMSTIRELEMNTRMGRKLEQLTDQQRFGAAASLIGKHVKGTVSDEEGNEFTIEGTVKSVRFTSKGEAILELDNGALLPLARLEEVRNPDGTLLDDDVQLVDGSEDDTAAAA